MHRFLIKKMKKYKVVFHLDEVARDRVNLVLNNIENLMADLGEDHVEIELVANSKGVAAFLKDPDIFVAKIEQLSGRGVQFAACANSLQSLGILSEDLLEFVEVVPAGVGELVKKQALGWAYIRP